MTEEYENLNEEEIEEMKDYFDKKGLVREVKSTLRKDILVPDLSDY